jgi:50S ribosomal subunit-associated GTPase HflX
MLPKAPQVIVGNKVDLISETEQEGVVDTLPITADFYSSAKTGQSVEEMFSTVSKKMLEAS